MQNEKFIAPFIEFIREDFDFNEHFFIIIGGLEESVHPIPDYDNIFVLDNRLLQKKNLLEYSKSLKPYFEQATKVILHSIFMNNIIDFLFFNIKYAKKSYWVMWGGDLYTYLNRNRSWSKRFYEFRKKIVIRNFAGFITFVEGDYNLAKKWWDVKGKYFECITYPSNFYKELDIKSKTANTINIQIGNSADPQNRHLEVLEKLSKYKDHNLKIIVPLSYGNKNYAEEVIQKGREIFGNKFEPLTDFIPFEKYLDLLGQIDIAIFNHRRQQAMGNIVTLLGLGKKVYIRNDITTWELFKKLGIEIYNIEALNIDLIDKNMAIENKRKIKSYFSKENAKKQLENFFAS